MKNKGRLTEGDINKTLVKLTLHMIIGIVGMSLFNLIDTWFIGQLGTKELAAISFTFPIILVIGSISMGLGIGTSSVIARAIGEGNLHKVKILSTDSILLSFLVVVFFVILGLITIEPLFLMLGASKDLIVLIKQYMIPWYIGVPFVITPMIGNSIIRATGDTKTPSRIMLLAITINLILDPILIFGYGPFPKLGIYGAAIATVISRFATMIFSLKILYSREKLIILKLRPINEIYNSWKEILYIGFPASGTNLIMPMSLGIVTHIIAKHGNNAIAGFGVGIKVGMFTTSVVLALGSVLAPFVGQNWGAGKINRVRHSIRSSFIFSMIWGFFSFILFIFFSDFLASMFNNNKSIIEIASSYLIIISFSFGFRGVLRLSGNVFNALNKPRPAIILVFIQMIVLTIPLSYIGSWLYDIKGIFYAVAISNIISGAIAYFWIKRVLREKSNPLI